MIIQMLMGAGGSATPTITFTNGNFIATGYLGDGVFIIFKPDGTMDILRPHVYFSAENWATPTTSGIGNNYWVRVATPSGNGTVYGTFNTWIQMSSDVSFTMDSAPINQGRFANSTYQISSSPTGSPVVASGNMEWISYGANEP